MKGFRLFLVGLYLLGAMLVFTRPARAAGVFVVNSTADTHIGFCGINPVCTLRDAIATANLVAGSDGTETLIAFNIPGPGPHTINVASALPQIDGNYITIDGTTEPDYAGTPIVELDGTLATDVNVFTAGIWINGDHTTIRGLVINNFAQGIIVLSPLNLFEGNYIGTDVTGTMAKPNTTGIDSFQSAPNNRIGNSSNPNVTGGGACTSPCNLISGNRVEGIPVYPGSDLTIILGNLIGTDITGTVALPNEVGIDLAADLAFINGNVISGNLEEGVRLEQFSDSIVEHNYIGTDTFGNAALPNMLGVMIQGIEPRRISGYNRVAHNLISGNTNGGVFIEDSSGDILWDNKIGTNAAGTATIPGGSASIGVQVLDPDGTEIGGNDGGQGNLIVGHSSGIEILHVDAEATPALAATIAANTISGNGWGIRVDVPAVQIGGPLPGDRNFITGSSGFGIFLNGPDARNTLVQGNFIGVNAVGVHVGNREGIRIDEAPDNLIGGPGSGEGNVIAGNGVGLFVTGVGSTGNRIQGNQISQNDSDPTHWRSGIVVIFGASNTLIGGTTPGAGNMIFDHPLMGIALDSGAHDNTVQGNIIGVDFAGTTPHPNSHGISIVNSSNNLIGHELDPLGANTIAYNYGNGIHIRGDGSQGNRIFGNEMYGNGNTPFGGLGINLDEDMITLNDDGDADTGPNQLQNFPEITTTFTLGGSTFMSGDLSSTPLTSFRIELFANTECNGLGYGEGRRLLTSFTESTDAAGILSFTPPSLSEDLTGEFLTLTATDLALNNTSEFSECYSVLPIALAIPAELDELIVDIEGFVPDGVLPQGQATALTSLLSSAEQQFESKNYKAAINKMHAFDNQVQAFKKQGKLDSDVAQDLLDRSGQIVQMIQEASQ